MQKTCAQCQALFEITESDLKFYDKISPVIAGEKYQIPPPILCPDCRLQRRLAFRNGRKFYHRKCDLTGKQIVSTYAPEAPYKVYDSDEWWSDKWDPLDYGLSFDFKRPFFDQFDELKHAVPRPNLMREQCENCQYAHNTTFSRNCYMCPMVFHSEDCYYVSMSVKCKSVVDSQSLANCELCYDSLHTQYSYSCIECQDCMNCTECLFCFDCSSCEKCIGCIGLKGKKLHAFNKPITEEEYNLYKKNLGSFSIYSKMYDHVQKVWKDIPRRHSFQISSENCTGNHIYNSRNAQHCFQVNDCEDSSYCHNAKQFKDSMDVFGALMGGELQYECSSAGGGMRTFFAYLSWHNTDCAYLSNCHNSNNLFGCVGLKHKKYCILNKQYSKEEYEELLPKIIEHMQKTNEYGYFFPARTSPYCYNETLAMDYFPLSREEAEAKGWSWRTDTEEKEQHSGHLKDIPDSIGDIKDSICDAVLLCENTGRSYRIIPQELAFYKKMQIPIPRTCPEERHLNRLARINPRKLWARTCNKCQNDIQTSYQPSRPEIIYCEQCYLEEVY
jgi:hypothetical protein